jgi:hypothetical protein
MNNYYVLKICFRVVGGTSTPQKGYYSDIIYYFLYKDSARKQRLFNINYPVPFCSATRWALYVDCSFIDEILNKKQLNVSITNSDYLCTVINNCVSYGSKHKLKHNIQQKNTSKQGKVYLREIKELIRLTRINKQSTLDSLEEKVRDEDYVLSRLVELI